MTLEYILTLEFGTFRGDELLCLVVPRDGRKRKPQTFKRKRKVEQKKMKKKNIESSRKLHYRWHIEKKKVYFWIKVEDEIQLFILVFREFNYRLIKNLIYSLLLKFIIIIILEINKN